MSKIILANITPSLMGLGGVQSNPLKAVYNWQCLMNPHTNIAINEAKNNETIMRN